ncbi:unnamed protein product [Lampetra planeri]
MIWGMFRQRAGGVWAQAWAVIGAVKEALWMARQKLIKGAYMSPPEVCRLARGLLERVVEVERATAGDSGRSSHGREVAVAAAQRNTFLNRFSLIHCCGSSVSRGFSSHPGVCEGPRPGGLGWPCCRRVGEPRALWEE